MYSNGLNSQRTVPSSTAYFSLAANVRLMKLRRILSGNADCEST
ncbi:unnamed protein product [Acanthoscelides obtectus]|uniref:Uncharacterized protein n=1 Tax=Acanthoscelides obtectus TaxID=200917 RepID=A0A9P0P389_ACAOB|nr:unnamed protein product [Acanthoscelides obtectus]CAK1648600.1 hypothetical protein AOBTE_LOCUS15777 [Acanthoscelides obtectus]